VIKVGIALSLSGRFAAQGNQAHHGLLLWVEDVNNTGGLFVRDRGGKELLKLVLHDDESRREPALARVEELIVKDRADILIGPYSSALTLAVAPVVERYRKVMWNHGGSSDAIFRGSFRFTVSIPSPARRYFVGILEMVKALDPSSSRVALLHGRSGTFSRAVVLGVEAYAKDNGLRVVLRAPYPSTPPGFASLVSRISASQPDVILGAGRTEDDLRLARQLRAQRVGARVMGLVAAPIQLFGQNLGKDAHGFFGPSQWEQSVRGQPDVGPTSAEFVARFRDRFWKEPDYPAAQAYAAGLVAHRCIEAAGTLRDEPIRRVASELAMSTFYGGFKLDAVTGEQIGHELVIIQWQGKAKRIVWPLEMAEARPQVPRHPNI
jgi:branched-chain amino acid transport system substrate-binding protein